ncbi:unnamed protein product [Symbiodinium natans]|uniref:Uncharacterized protein n=1 Tax=Symbiodinium natans TaxID=878477 RepID=A0A812LYH0_9DINO|nr:unnamed protein product [Symbiodinium natans]
MPRAACGTSTPKRLSPVLAVSRSATSLLSVATRGGRCSKRHPTTILNDASKFVALQLAAREIVLERLNPGFGHFGLLHNTTAKAQATQRTKAKSFPTSHKELCSSCGASRAKANRGESSCKCAGKMAKKRKV